MGILVLTGPSRRILEDLLRRSVGVLGCRRNFHKIFKTKFRKIGRRKNDYSTYELDKKKKKKRRKRLGKEKNI